MTNPVDLRIEVPEALISWHRKYFGESGPGGSHDRCYTTAGRETLELGSRGGHVETDMERMARTGHSAHGSISA